LTVIGAVATSTTKKLFSFLEQEVIIHSFPPGVKVGTHQQNPFQAQTTYVEGIPHGIPYLKDKDYWLRLNAKWCFLYVVVVLVGLQRVAVVA
jgi:hypothetical protein